jgi:hypothetical protein
MTLVVAVVVMPSIIPTMDENTTPNHINPQYTHAALSVLQMCQELSEILMIDAFGKRPFPCKRPSSLTSI